jgi:hypothetical protein
VRFLIWVGWLFVAITVALVFTTDIYGYNRSPQLEQVATTFAMRPAEVRCPSTDEWTHFTLEQLGASDPELTFGATHLFEDWIELRPDVCFAAQHVTDETIHPMWRALAVLTLTHESYHVRRWGGRRDESKVECQAIRHFRVAAQFLGASSALADRLYWHAVVWHFGIARPNTYYYSPTCKVPGQ